MPIQSLAHACIKTTDLDTTTDFYCGALGMTKFFNFTRKGKVIGFYLKAANETFVEVFLANEIEQTEKRLLHHFCLQTEDLEGLRQAILAKGYAPKEIKLGADQTPQFWMKDPNGLDLEFQQYTAQSAQLTGRDVEVDW